MPNDPDKRPARAADRSLPASGACRRSGSRGGRAARSHKVGAVDARVIRATRPGRIAPLPQANVSGSGRRDRARFALRARPPFGENAQCQRQDTRNGRVSRCPVRRNARRVRGLREPAPSVSGSRSASRSTAVPSGARRFHARRGGNAQRCAGRRSCGANRLALRRSGSSARQKPSVAPPKVVAQAKTKRATAPTINAIHARLSRKRGPAKKYREFSPSVALRTEACTRNPRTTQTKNEISEV